MHSYLEVWILLPDYSVFLFVSEKKQSLKLRIYAIYTDCVYGLSFIFS